MSEQRKVASSGVVILLVGMVTLVLSRVVESGFLHGAFLGMTVALMVIGAVVLGRTVWPSGGDRDRRGGSMWLPSKDRRE